MKNPLFSGVCTALVTPFLDGKVNYPMMEQLLRRQVDAGVKAVVITGTTGESSTLSDDEKLELFWRSKAYVKDGCKVIAGTGSNNTAHSLHLSKEAQDAGVDGLLLVSPYYNKANAEGLVAHYMTIAHGVSLPVIIYNVPGRTGVDIPVSVYERLSKIPNIVGVKEAGGNITKVIRTINQCPDDFSVWSGNDDQIVPIISVGGAGVISVLSNICPQETVAMTDAALNGDYKKAAALQRRLMPLIDLLFSDVNPIPVKAVLQEIGYDCGGCRLPLTGPNKETKEKIRQMFL